MLQENVLRERDIAISIASRVRRILYKFELPKVCDECCEKQESKTILDYQNDINTALDDIYKNLDLLDKYIGD